MSRKLTILVLLFCVAALAETALDVLTQALVAEPTVENYVGEKTIILYNGAQAEAMEVRVSFEAGGATRTDYLSPPAMRERVVIDDGADLYSYDPHLEVTVHSDSPQMLDDRLSDTERRDLIAGNYILELEPNHTVAGRDAYRVEITSRHNATPHRILWIDSKNYLVLQSREECNDSAANTGFSWIEFNVEFSPDYFSMGQFTGTVVEEAAPVSKSARNTLPEELGLVPVVPEKLPGGFVLVETRLGYRANGQYAAHLSYTDGLEGLSVFEEAQEGSLKGQEIALGETMARLSKSANYSVLQWRAGDITFTLVGQLTNYGLYQVAAYFVTGK
ncbi:MAG TPA: sigma-E factor regulatory protein RseB domain-containing protein [bacterium]|nr:sigma-E factor regulatory protein RseB domain-containing protein [bacterium]